MYNDPLMVHFVLSQYDIGNNTESTYHNPLEKYYNMVITDIILIIVILWYTHMNAATAHSVYVWLILIHKNELNLFQTNNGARMYLFYIPWYPCMHSVDRNANRDSHIPAVDACAALPRFIFDTNPKKANFIHNPITVRLLFSVHSLQTLSLWFCLSLSLTLPISLAHYAFRITRSVTKSV